MRRMMRVGGAGILIVAALGSLAWGAESAQQDAVATSPQQAEPLFDQAAFDKAMAEHRERMKDFQFDRDAFDQAMEEHQRRMEQFHFDQEAFDKAMAEHRQRLEQLRAQREEQSKE